MHRLHYSPALVKHHKKTFGGVCAQNGGEEVAKQAAVPAARGEMCESRREHQSSWVQAMQEANCPSRCPALQAAVQQACGL